MINTQQNKALKQLVWIGIGAIGMFFAGLTSAYIVRKAEGNWMEFILPDWFLYSTITIILSSFILVLAKQKIKTDQYVQIERSDILKNSRKDSILAVLEGGLVSNDNKYVLSPGDIVGMETIEKLVR